jgi:YesN/AraC family two-component response regulator
MIIYIKNMVCNRCIMAVENIFHESGILPVQVSLGEVVTSNDLSPKTLQIIEYKLNNLGFEIIDDHKSRLIEKTKNIVIELIHHSEGVLNVNYSTYIASKINKDYNYLSNLFTSIEGITLEQYIIHQKIEKIKELLVYNELTISEIAFKMGYSSVAYLSNQFKKVTGLTPSHFKQIGQLKRKPLDQVK